MTVELAFGPDRSEFVRTREDLRLHAEIFEPAVSADEPSTLLMIMGGNAPCFAFPDSLCRAVAAAGHRVVRYDHRGAGRSSSVDFPAQSYPLTALAADAADVIRELALDAPVVFGISTGGATAQLLALDHPAAVSGLILMATSPDYNVNPDIPPESGLPGPGPDWVSLVHDMAANPAIGHDAMVADYLRGWQACVGPAMSFDEDYWRALVERTLQSPDNPAPGAHQGPAVDAAPPRAGRLPSIRVPTMVIHGGHDVVLPPEHGRALAEAIGGSRLVEIPELGHMFPPEFTPRLADLLIDHIGTVAR